MIKRETQDYYCDECGCDFEGVSYQVHYLNGTWDRMCYECKEFHVHNAEQILGEDWWS